MMKPVAMPSGGMIIFRKEVGCFPARIRSMISVRPASAETMTEPTWIKCVDNNTASSLLYRCPIISFIVLQKKIHCKHRMD
jgi:hypothetical protein